MKVTKALTEPQKPMSRAEYKRAMGTFFTQRHDQVSACGHKFHPTDEPRTGCGHCWAAFFFTQGQIAAIADEVFQKEGVEVLIKVKGKRFTKWYLRFMNEIQKRLRENEGIRAVEGSSTGTDDISGEMASANSGNNETVT
jgi:hypothetical protein